MREQENKINEIKVINTEVISGTEEAHTEKKARVSVTYSLKAMIDHAGKLEKEGIINEEQVKIVTEIVKSGTLNWMLKGNK